MVLIKDLLKLVFLDTLELKPSSLTIRLLHCDIVNYHEENYNNNNNLGL